jgi:UDP-N-acetyl-D-mannosaminuronic acid dehydrogenase
MRFWPAAGAPRIAVIGFGYVGSCLGVTLAGAGFDVVGVDRDRDLVADLAAGRCRVPEPGLAEALAGLAGGPLLAFTTDYDAVRAVDVVVVTVGTPVDDGGALETAQLEEVCAELAPRLRPGQLVLLKSTVAPGVTRGLVKPLLEGSGLVQGEDFGLAYCPERLAEGDALAQLVTLPVVVGGCDPASADAADLFWRTALGVEVRRVPDADVAEVVKLASNWWIDVNVAMANELARFCALYGVDVLDVISAANSLPKGTGRVNVLLPSVGVGGSCLTKDPWMVWRAARDRGADLRTVRTAREVNDAMPDYAAGLIGDELAKLGKDVGSATVAVLGAAFKSDTGDLRHTPVLGVVRALRATGATVRLFDPLADPDAMRRVFGVEPERELADAVVGADCVAVLAGHRAFADLPPEWLAGLVSLPCLVFDGRAYYSREYIERLRRNGFGYRGIGR